MRHPKAKRTISKEILERHYNDENLSVSKIARKLGVGHATVWNLMASYQIQRRQIRKNLNAQQVIAAYSKPKESLSSLAKKFGCTVWTIQYLLRKNGVRIREGWEVNFKHIKNNFSGNLIEKAYLIGFRLGDLNCARKSERIIQVKSNTTKKAQLDLMKSLFEKYGPCYLGEDKEGTFNFAAALNNSFEFLIPKRIESKNGFCKMILHFGLSLRGIQTRKAASKFTKTEQGLGFPPMTRTSFCNFARS